MQIGGIGIGTWGLYALAAIAAIAIQAAILVGFGILASKAPVAARFVLWPIGLAMALVFLPGLFVGLLFFGFMTPQFGGHLNPPEQQSVAQRGLNGLIELIAAPWKAATA